jgi:four helix bundle protein
MEYDYTLEQLEVYQMAESFSDEIWSIVLTFDQFKRDTIGKQIVRSADSVSANIAEGYGRFYFAESKQFYYYARGSLQETKAWLSKCKRRRLVESSLIDQLTETAELILIKLNAYIRFVANSPKHNRRD